MGATYLSVDFSLKLNYNEEHLREGCKLQKLNRNADFMWKLFSKNCKLI